jgi:formylmethanofuran dehydrogenase subunit E
MLDYFDEVVALIMNKSFLKVSYLLEQEASNKNLSLEDVEKNQKQLLNLERQIFDYREVLDKKNVNYKKIMSSINIILDRIY